MNQLRRINYRYSELNELIDLLLPLIKKHKVIALNGALGAGKTTFTAALCRYLKTKEKADSPTFSLINQYSFIDENNKEQTIYHSDWYRLEDEEEAIYAGIEDLFNNDFFVCLVEWSENLPDLLPDNALKLYFLPDAIEPEKRSLLLF